MTLNAIKLYLIIWVSAKWSVRCMFEKLEAMKGLRLTVNLLTPLRQPHKAANFNGGGSDFLCSRIRTAERVTVITNRNTRCPSVNRVATTWSDQSDTATPRPVSDLCLCAGGAPLRKTHKSRFSTLEWLDVTTVSVSVSQTLFAHKSESLEAWGRLTHTHRTNTALRRHRFNLRKK